MHEQNSRRPAATGHWKTRLSSRFIGLCAVALAAALLAGGALETAPAEGGTSPKYERLWNKMGPKHKRWARQTAMCESGKDPRAHGGGGVYHGAFQFMLQTWRNSPKSPGGDPHRKSFRTQAVVAVELKKRDGARTHWPHCG